MTADQRQQFRTMFSSVPRANPTLLSGAEARGFFAQSGLDAASLGKIWSVAAAFPPNPPPNLPVPPLPRTVLSSHADHLGAFLTLLLILTILRTLADRNNDGQLDVDEFGLAMYLVQLRRSGANLPDILPDSLLQSYKAPAPTNALAMTTNTVRPP